MKLLKEYISQLPKETIHSDWKVGDIVRLKPGLYREKF